MTRCPVIGDEAIAGVRRLLLQHGVQTKDPARQVLSTRAPDRNTVTSAAHLRSRDVQAEETEALPIPHSGDRGRRLTIDLQHEEAVRVGS